MDALGKIEKLDQIAILRMDAPPVNALGAGLRRWLMSALNDLESDSSISLVLLTGTGRFFSAGADIKEFGKPVASPTLPDVISRFENFKLPIIAAINGIDLGGGLELALACRYRLGLFKAKLGLPEVSLGLIPGAGGTQRLPRVVGLKNAAEMICKGKPIDGVQAKSIGLLDDVWESDLLENAQNHAKALITSVENGSAKYRLPLFETDVETDIDVDWWSQSFRSDLERRSRGQISPLKAFEAVSVAGNVPFEKGLEIERNIFLDCMNSPQRQGLIHAFFAERQVGKLSKQDMAVAKTVNIVAVLGAGTMGVGISAAFASKGFQVLLFDINDDVLKAGYQRVQKIFEQNVSKGRMTEKDCDRAKGNLTFIASLGDIGDADLVIEAVVERMDIKKSVFEQLDGIMKPEAILASNTSYLDINEIARVTSRAENVIGMHFFSPAHIMKLLEVIRTDKVSNETLSTVLSVAKRVGKIAVISGMCDGFIGNRIFKTYRKQAEYLVENGAMPQDVDRVMKAFGFAMGPFAVSDLAGLDIGWHTRRREDADRPKQERYVDLADRLYDLGRLGQKTGAGWYKYELGNRLPIVDEVVEELILAASDEKKIIRRKIEDDEILNRILFSMVNEGSKILDEGIAARATDIDVVYLHGYGFPRHEGGPMFYADKIGARNILEKIKAYAKDDPYTWEASPLLVTLSRDNSTFHGIEG